MEIHRLGEDQFCSGASFVPRVGGPHEDDGWIISFVHDERTNTSQASFHCNTVLTHPNSYTKYKSNFEVLCLQVHIIDTKRFEGAPVAKITLPQRVPYGFHGTFIHSNTNGHVNTKPSTN
jgi:carotenoid cleavage dioxygenase-like enzyme